MTHLFPEADVKDTPEILTSVDPRD